MDVTAASTKIVLIRIFGYRVGRLAAVAFDFSLIKPVSRRYIDSDEGIKTRNTMARRLLVLTR